MPDPTDDRPYRFRYASISELATALRSRRISAGELARETVASLAEIAPRFNALASVTADRAVGEASAADEALTHGVADVLCGIPYAVKDLFAARGAPTTWGSPTFAERSFRTDATAIRNLSERGAVLTAKLAMSELAGGGHPSRAGASLHGPGRNPWDPRHYSGGSSSGSGIVVSLGLVPFALGTETGGSIIGPAAFTGVTGLRPTFGTVPLAGVMTLSWSLDKVGPLARSAEDCAIVMGAISGRRRRADFAEIVDRSETRAARGWPDVKVACSSSEIDEAAPSIRETLGRGFDEFRSIAPMFVDAEIDRDGRFIAALEHVVQVEGAFSLRDAFARTDFQMTDAQQQSTLRAGLDVPSAVYLDALRTVRADAAAAFRRMFSVADVILSASRAAVAPPLDGPRPPRDPTKMSELLRAAANLVGLPGVSFPCGLSDEGLPVGLHLLGPRGSDALLLALAATFQRSTSHHRLRPATD